MTDELRISNKDVCEFYNQNKHLDFEKMNYFLAQFLSNIQNSSSFSSSSPSKLCESLNQNTKMGSSSSNLFCHESNPQQQSFKRELGETNNQSGTIKLQILLNNLYSTSDIKTDDEYPTSLILDRSDKKPLYIENYESYTNCPRDGIESFMDNVKQNNMNSLFLSQHSGITDKSNYSIDIMNEKVILYIHSANYDSDKIKIAVDIIDKISSKMKEIGSSEIPEDVLCEIKNEFQNFSSKKEIIIDFIKENNNELLRKVYGINFKSLDGFLSTKFNIKTTKKFECNYCAKYMSNTLKGMAAHKRGCVKKTFK
jgi:hypothetical protein